MERSTGGPLDDSFVLAIRAVDRHTVVEVGGEVDIDSAPRLRDRLVEVVDGGARHVIVDLKKVDFLDSTGLGVLVGILKRLRGVGGTLALVCDKESLLKIFRVTALDQVFPLFRTIDAAIGVEPAGPAA